MTRRNRKKKNKNSKTKKINPHDDVEEEIISDHEKRIMEYIFAIIFFLSIAVGLIYAIKLISILI